MSIIRARIVDFIQVYCRTTGTSYDALARRATGDNKVVRNLIGGRDVKLRSIERLESYIRRDMRSRMQACDPSYATHI